LVGASQKTPFLKLKLPKSTLLTISICTHVNNMGSFEQTMLCLWPQLAHLAWKPWNFIQDSSFVWTLFQNVCNIPSLLFFLATRSHNMTQSEGFIFFWFFWTSYVDFKMRPNRRAWPLQGRDVILRNYLWISDEIDTCVPKNDFWKKLWANYEAPVDQIWPASSWIDRYLWISGGVSIELFPSKQMANCA
jgi:hypothetical protein